MTACVKNLKKRVPHFLKNTLNPQVFDKTGRPKNSYLHKRTKNLCSHTQKKLYFMFTASFFPNQKKSGKTKMSFKEWTDKWIMVCKYPGLLHKNKKQWTIEIYIYIYIYKTIVVVQSLSPVWLFVTPWTPACQASLSFTISWSLRKFMSIEAEMLSKYLILCGSLFLLSVFPRIRVFFQWVSCLQQVAKVLELPLQHRIFRIDFL